ERVGRRTAHAIDEHAVEHALGEVDLPGNRGGPGAPRSGRDPCQHPPDDHRVPGNKGRDVVRVRRLCRRQPPKGASYPLPNPLTRQSLLDPIWLAEETHPSLPDGTFGT